MLAHSLVFIPGQSSPSSAGGVVFATDTSRLSSTATYTASQTFGSSNTYVGASSFTATVTISSNVLVTSTASYDIPLVVGIGGDNSAAKAAGANVLAMFGDKGTSPRIVVRDHTNNTEIQLKCGASCTAGTYSNTNLILSIGDATAATLDTSGNMAFGQSSFPSAKLTIGDNNTGNGSKFQVQGGSISSNGANSGFAIDGRSINDSSFTRTASEYLTSTTINGSGGGAYSLTVTTPGAVGGYHVAITTWGTTSFNGSSPTISNCGAAPNGACIGCTNEAGTIAVGGGVPTACTLNFTNPTIWKAVPGNPTCTVNDNNAAVAVAITARSNTAITFGMSATLGGGELYYHCFGVRE